MTERRSHPAVYAGLLGSAVWGTPAHAYALSLDGMVDTVAGSLALQIALGCAAGVVVAGSAIYLAYRKSNADVEMKDYELLNELWVSSSLDMLRAQQDLGDDEPTSDLGRIRTGQITIDPVLQAKPQSVDGQASRRPRQSAHLASAHVVAKAPTRASGRHFAAPAETVAPAHVEPAPAVRGRHFAAPAAAQKAERPLVRPTTNKPAPMPVARPIASSVPLVEAVDKTPAPAPVAQAARNPRERLMALPTIESRYDKARAVPAVTNDANPVGDFSSNYSTYANSSSKRERSDGQAAGITGRIKLRVREVLASRLEADALDGVPIITRADGSANEVTPTWFDQTFVPKLASLTGVNNKLDDTAAREFGAAASPAQSTMASMAARERASYISRHVAEVNVGVFPERRSVDELEHNDVWEEALASMAETLGQPAPVFQNVVFQDVVGGPSTIDDPDGLEGSTSIIPFKVPAAHPEVVDTETYVDFLLRDELSHSGLKVLRQSPHAHLRVIEGGTGNLRTRRRAGETGAVRTGRHFAPSALVQEA